MSSRNDTLAELMAELADPNLTLTLRRAHWVLVDPWLDAACRYVTEQDAGRHRWDPDHSPRGTWRPWAPPTTLGPGRHACKCGICQHEEAFVGIATAYAALDEALGQ